MARSVPERVIVIMGTAFETIQPGGTLGILGDGQLGRMLALAARRLGYRVHVFGPEKDSPAGHVADHTTCASYDNLDAVREFARRVDVVTFEFENVPSKTSEAAATFAPVRPGGHVLHTTQQRLREKEFLSHHGFPVAAFRAVRSLSDLTSAATELGLPGVLKTASFGYDGKGQQKLTSVHQLESAFNQLNGAEGVFEAWVSFECEASLVAARSGSGEFVAYPLIRNAHANHILDISIAPAMLPPSTEQAALAMGREILEALDVVGVLTVEMFIDTAGQIIVNELAPRTHNSGHLTIDACCTSQFDQQLRAVCGLPLGSTELMAPAAMANLLGDIWIQSKGTPNWAAALSDPHVRLHLYGKKEPRAGRKMGHLTVTAPTPEEASQRARLARARL